MRAKELMIGDWVYSTFSDKPCKVIGIEQYESEYVNVKVTNVTGAKDINSLFFIPLTAEILEKNGFEKSNQISDTPPYYMDEEGNIYYSFEQNGVNRFWGWWQPDNVFEVPANAMGWISIKYVHELQHALRLCGITHGIVL